MELSPATRDGLKLAALVGLLMASSCAAPTNDANGLFDDGVANHPIAVEPDSRILRLSFSAADAGLLPEDDARFTAFAADYIAHGTGSISISVPADSGGNDAIRYFGQRLTAMGVPGSAILVGRADMPSNDRRVVLNYITYAARIATCDRWASDLSSIGSNRVSPGLGCSVQQNLAAMVADKRDLVVPRVMDDRDARRRAVVFDNYEKGQPTAASKTSEQSGAVSSVGTR